MFHLIRTFIFAIFVTVAFTAFTLKAGYSDTSLSSKGARNCASIDANGELQISKFLTDLMTAKSKTLVEYCVDCAGDKEPELIGNVRSIEVKKSGSDYVVSVLGESGLLHENVQVNHLYIEVRPGFYENLASRLQCVHYEGAKQLIF